MQLVEIDDVGLQPAEGIFTGPQNVAARIAAVIWPGAGWIVDLRRQHNGTAFVALLQPAADEPFTVTTPITVGRVHEIDPGVNCAVEQRMRGVFVDRVGEVVSPEANRGDFEAAATEMTVVHGHFSFVDW